MGGQSSAFAAKERANAIETTQTKWQAAGLRDDISQRSFLKSTASSTKIASNAEGGSHSQQLWLQLTGEPDILPVPAHFCKDFLSRWKPLRTFASRIIPKWEWESERVIF